MLSVIIPAYNEESYLPKTLASIKAAISEIDFPAEIIVVDNESTDETSRIAVDFGAKVISETGHNIATVRNTGAKRQAATF